MDEQRFASGNASKSELRPTIGGFGKAGSA
jgi:hypothetical protein